MAAQSLRCRECGAEYALEARYVCERCFGPLEVSYERHESVDVDGLRRRIQAGPQNIWRYADFLPLRGAAGPVGPLASRAGLPAGCTPLVRADRLAERLGLREVWVKNDRANPTHSFKDRVVTVAAAPGPRARLRDPRLRLHRQPGQLRRRHRRRRSAWSPTSSSRPTSRSRRSSRPASTARTSSRSTATTTTSTASAPRSPASCELGVRERQHAALLRGGLQDRWRTRSPSSSAGARRDRVVAPIASGSLFTKIAKGFEEFARARPHRGRPAADERRAGPGLLAGRHRLGRGHGRLPPGQAGHDRQVAGHRQPGRRALRARAGPQRAAAGSTGRPTTRSAHGIRLLAETTGIFTETAGGVTTATLAKLAARGDIEPDETRRARHHRRRPQDARRGARDVRGPRDRARRSTSAVESAGRGHGLMAVTVKLPTQLRAAAGGAAKRQVEGDDRRRRPRGAATGEHPTLRDRLSDGDGGLRRFVNVYVDGEDVRFGDGLGTPSGGRHGVADPPGRRRRLTRVCGFAADFGPPPDTTPDIAGRSRCAQYVGAPRWCASSIATTRRRIARLLRAQLEGDGGLEIVDEAPDIDLAPRASRPPSRTSCCWTASTPSATRRPSWSPTSRRRRGSWCVSGHPALVRRDAARQRVQRLREKDAPLEELRATCCGAPVRVASATRPSFGATAPSGTSGHTGAGGQDAARRRATDCRASSCRSTTPRACTGTCASSATASWPPGRSRTASRSRPRTTGSRSAPRTTRSSTSSSTARSRRATTAPGRCASGTAAPTRRTSGTTRKVEVTFHGERLRGRYALFPLRARARRPARTG